MPELQAMFPRQLENISTKRIWVSSLSIDTGNCGWLLLGSKCSSVFIAYSHEGICGEKVRKRKGSLFQEVPLITKAMERMAPAELQLLGLVQFYSWSRWSTLKERHLPGIPPVLLLPLELRELTCPFPILAYNGNGRVPYWHDFPKRKLHLLPQLVCLSVLCCGICTPPLMQWATRGQWCTTWHKCTKIFVFL